MQTWFSVRTREHFLTTSFARASSGPCAGLEGAPWASAAPPDLGLAVQTYDIQGSLQKHSQVTVSIVLENQGHSVLKNMELNVLDSLNTKLARPEGSSVHDGVPVPFQLPPGEPAVTSRAWWRPGATEGLSSSSHLLASVPGSHLPAARELASPPGPVAQQLSGPTLCPTLARNLQRSPVRVHHSEHRHGPETQGDPVLHCQGTQGLRPWWGLQDPSHHSRCTQYPGTGILRAREALGGSPSQITGMCPSSSPLTLRPCSQQNEEGSTHEKLDFKLHFSCTSYLITTPCYRCAVPPCFHAFRLSAQSLQKVVCPKM